MLPEVSVEIERLIDAYFPHAELNEMLRSFVKEKQSEGSRWAEITTTAHHMFGGRSPHIVHNAAAAELILLTLDIVDDLQDQDNQQKPWMTIPQPLALNAILSLIALVAGELGASLGGAAPGSASVLSEIGRLLSGSIYGQQLDISGAVATEEDYVEMVYHKSGLLMQLACFLGYAFVEPAVDDSAIAAMNELARYAGIISQLENDLDDILRMDFKNDLVNKKKTLPVLFLLKGSPDEFPALLEYYTGGLSKEQFLAMKLAILDYIESSGCIEYTRTIRILYQEQAARLLDSLPISEDWKRKFKETVNL